MDKLIDKNHLINMCIKARKASIDVLDCSGDKKNKALLQIAEDIIEEKKLIIQMNKMDLDEGKKAGLSSALLDRLELTEERIESMACGLRDMAAFKEPIGEVLDGWRTEGGLDISKVRVPIGVIAMIFESRPNVTIDAAGLSIKSSNAIILRGGKEAINSNIVLSNIARESLKKIGLPEDLVQVVPGTDRALVTELIRANGYVDCIIPRGGKGLKKAIVANATVPVIETGSGVCHLYIHKDADKDMAINIAINAKTQRTGVCNAIESLLIHDDFLYKKDLIDALIAKGVSINGDEKSILLNENILKASSDDYYNEYLDMIISLKIVSSVEEAIAHINEHGTKHSEAIVTNDILTSELFLNKVDASTVYLNASTRFTDGSEFGFGGEIGISTQKLHARGPMGVRELTTSKYIVRGKGNIR